MPRKRKLDPYVTSFVDRHNKERFRFRKGELSFYISPPGTPAYKAEYAKAMEGFAPQKRANVRPRSVEDLVQRFYRSPRFNRGGEKWQATVRAVIEPFREEFANDRVDDFDFEHIEVILGRAVKQEVDDKGRKRGGTFAATRLYEQLKRLFAYAVRLRWIAANPVSEAELPAVHVVKGFHVWTLDELIRFDERHPFGTKARLAKEIAFWTGLRRGDVAGLTAEECAGGRIDTTASKTKKSVNVKIAGALKRAMDALPLAGEGPLLRTEHGKPFSTVGLGNWFRDRCNEAGLPNCSLHGLRKSFTTLAAEAGASQQELKAYGQWAQDAEVATYTKKANQKVMADSAVSKVEHLWTKANPPEKVRQNDEVL